MKVKQSYNALSAGFNLVNSLDVEVKSISIGTGSSYSLTLPSSAELLTIREIVQVGSSLEVGLESDLLDGPLNSSLLAIEYSDHYLRAPDGYEKSLTNSNGAVWVTDDATSPFQHYYVKQDTQTLGPQYDISETRFTNVVKTGGTFGYGFWYNYAPAVDDSALDTWLNWLVVGTSTPYEIRPKDRAGSSGREIEVKWTYNDQIELATISGNRPFNFSDIDAREWKFIFIQFIDGKIRINADGVWIAQDETFPLYFPSNTDLHGLDLYNVMRQSESSGERTSATQLYSGIVYDTSRRLLTPYQVATRNFPRSQVVYVEDIPQISSCTVKSSSSLTPEDWRFCVKLENAGQFNRYQEKFLCKGSIWEEVDPLDPSSWMTLDQLQTLNSTDWGEILEQCNERFRIGFNYIGNNSEEITGFAFDYGLTVSDEVAFNDEVFSYKVHREGEDSKTLTIENFENPGEARRLEIKYLVER